MTATHVVGRLHDTGPHREAAHAVPVDQIRYRDEEGGRSAYGPAACGRFDVLVDASWAAWPPADLDGMDKPCALCVAALKTEGEGRG